MFGHNNDRIPFSDALLATGDENLTIPVNAGYQQIRLEQKVLERNIQNRRIGLR